MQAFLPLLPSTILIFFASSILFLRVIRPNFRYFWMLAVGGSFFSWLSVLYLRFWLPVSVDLLSWKPAYLFPVSPALLLDRISWPYALALSTLALAATLSDISRSTETKHGNWVGSLSFTALGILAALSGNPITLMLTWSALDLIELVILIIRVRPDHLRQQVLITFSARVAGIFSLVAASGFSRELPATFAQIEPQSSIFLLLAAGLRLGVFPLHLPFLEQAPFERGLSTLFSLIPAGTSFMLLTRTAAVIAPDSLALVLLVLTGLALLFASSSWAAADHELHGQPYWILAFAALAIASALRGEELASLAFGITGLLSGGILFLFSARQRYLLFIPIFGLLGASMLPLSPSWQAVRLYRLPISPILVLFIPAQALLLLGYIRHALRPTEPPNQAERWIWLFYPLGLMLMPITHILIAWFGNPTSRLETEWPHLIDSWPGFIVLFFSGGLYLAHRRGLRISPSLIRLFRRSLSMRWFYALFWKVYDWLGRSLVLISRILEGEGGILWALLLLIILLTLLNQQDLGG